MKSKGLGNKNAQKRKGGSPAILQVRIPERHKKALRNLADYEGISMSEWVIRKIEKAGGVK